MNSQQPTRTTSSEVEKLFRSVRLPASDSHKGQNGKLLLIGGSELFHAASKWSLDIASKFVDMVFYSSIPANNELILSVKGEFWNGIVIAREDLESYLAEADCVLIGPGMTRTPDTEQLTNHLLEKYSDKKWVIDAGALQMLDASLLNERCIVTPHAKEYVQLLEKTNDLHGATVVKKGQVDEVSCGELKLEVEGGNGGMTKGGTGDVLAGLIAALYCTNDSWTSAVLGSYTNKKAGDDLYATVGPNFNASDLVEQIPKTFWREYKFFTKK